MAKIKATPVNGLVRFVDGEITREQFQSVLDRLPEDERHWFTGKILAQEMVPVPAVNRFTVEAAREKGEDIKSFGRRAGRMGAKLGLRSVYKFLMVMMSVERVLKKAAFTWSRIYDTGSMEAETLDDGATIRVLGFPSEVPGCARVTGWIEFIGETAGADGITVDHAECIAEDGRECRWEVKWQ